jgi:hypothetical protein
MVRRLWGDMFYNKKGEWKRGDQSSDKEFKRGFVGMILDPIYQMFDATLNDKAEKVEKMLSSLNIVLKPEDRVRGEGGRAAAPRAASRLCTPTTPAPPPTPPLARRSSRARR